MVERNFAVIHAFFDTAEQREAIHRPIGKCLVVIARGRILRASAVCRNTGDCNELIRWFSTVQKSMCWCVSLLLGKISND